jgi:hypothetical protein
MDDIGEQSNSREQTSRQQQGMDEWSDGGDEES